MTTNINYFKDVKDLSELKKVYHSLAMKYHPDKNRDKELEYTEIMKQINSQYQEMFVLLKNEHNSKEENKDKKVNENPDSLINIINALIKIIPELEIVGTWIWIEKKYVNTQEIEEILTSLGFKFSTGRNKWYYGELMSSGKKWHSNKSFNELRNFYGSKKVTGNNDDDKKPHYSYKGKKKKSKLVFINVSKNAYNPV